MIDSQKLVEFAKNPEMAIQNLDPLLDLLDSKDETELSIASDLFENCGVPKVQDIPFLCEQLKSGRSSRVYWCSTLLGRFGQTVSDQNDRSRMHSNLCNAINDESLDLSARERAAWAMGEIGRFDNDCRAILKNHVDKAPPRLKRLLETALAT